VKITIEITTENKDRFQPVDYSTEPWERRVKEKKSEYDGNCRYVINDTQNDAHIAAFYDRETRDKCCAWLNMEEEVT